jgi:4-hydroxybenzoate polyprenyltransferase
VPAYPSAVRLLRAAHPLPAAAVTALAAGLAVAAGAGPARTALLAAAVAVGQLSIGWCNDWVDADDDRSADRRGKPVVGAGLPVATVRRAAIAALLTAVPLSLALGAVPGLLALTVVAGGWAYDLGVKRTAASPLPYLVAFGALPAAAVAAAGGTPRPALVAAGALLGSAGHFANTVPDAAADTLTGVRGLPQRVGPQASRVVAGGLVAAAAAVALAGTALVGIAPPSAVLLGAGDAAGVAGALVPRPAASFRAVLLAAVLAVAGLLAAGPQALLR